MLWADGVVDGWGGTASAERWVAGRGKIRRRRAQWSGWSSGEGRLAGGEAGVRRRGTHVHRRPVRNRRGHDWASPTVHVSWRSVGVWRLHRRAWPGRRHHMVLRTIVSGPLVVPARARGHHVARAVQGENGHGPLVRRAHSATAAAAAAAAVRHALRVAPTDGLGRLLAWALRGALGVVREVDVPADALEGRLTLHRLARPHGIVYGIKLHESNKLAVAIRAGACAVEADEAAEMALEHRVRQVGRKLRQEEAVRRRRT